MLPASPFKHTCPKNRKTKPLSGTTLLISSTDFGSGLLRPWTRPFDTSSGIMKEAPASSNRSSSHFSHEFRPQVRSVSPRVVLLRPGRRFVLPGTPLLFGGTRLRVPAFTMRVFDRPALDMSGSAQCNSPGKGRDACSQEQPGA